MSDPDPEEPYEGERFDHPAVTRRRGRVGILEAVLDGKHPDTGRITTNTREKREALDWAIFLISEDTEMAEAYEDEAERDLDGDDLVEIADLEEREARLWQIRKLKESF